VKDEKTFEKRVKECLNPLKGNPLSASGAFGLVTMRCGGRNEQSAPAATEE